MWDSSGVPITELDSGPLGIWPGPKIQGHVTVMVKSGDAPALPWQTNEAAQRAMVKADAAEGRVSSFEPRVDKAVTDASLALQLAEEATLPSVELVDARIQESGLPAAVTDAVQRAQAAETVAAAAGGEANEAATGVAAMRPRNSGRAVGQGELIFNVRDFGAVGNNTTNDSAAVQAALTAAAGNRLVWPAGTYLIAQTLSGLHQVRHEGPGQIVRGSVTFYPAPKKSQPNRLYVHPTSVNASDTNDGITSITPFKTVQAAFNALVNYGPVLDGEWTIQLAAGIYDEAVRVPENLRSVSPVTMHGPDVGGHPNVPTARFSRGAGAAYLGLRVYSPIELTVKDVKFSDYNGTSSSGGIGAANGAVVNAVNVHAFRCFYGLTSQGARLDAKGGIIEDCGRLPDGSGVGAGIRSLMLSRHSIGTQNAGTLALGPIIKGCRYGVYAQESSTGHVDYVTFEDNEDAVVLRVNSRANLTGSSFARNWRDVRADGNSHAFFFDPVFGTGANESQVHLLSNTGAEVTGAAYFTDRDPAYAVVPKTLQTMYPNQSIKATTTTLIHRNELKAPFWRNISTGLTGGKTVRVRVIGELIGTAGTKRVNLRLGDSTPASIVFTAVETGPFEVVGTIFFRDIASQLIHCSGTRHLGTSVRHAVVPATEAMTADTWAQVDGQVENTADTLLIHAVELGWTG
ncbi:hypothetical protein DT076_16550 [Desertihabitans brevis]|uniref:Rhamnogalacturonase A/B/Epimerase-like pectate lyase domain-containing protein n=2 Tax=Desertihabitans brevis TaxID=2268447 RepID=A0A367YR07_9ACTN|nr:hypothetical protein DT076_16550 [Desertihabitans brevis]